MRKPSHLTKSRASFPDFSTRSIAVNTMRGLFVAAFVAVVIDTPFARCQSAHGVSIPPEYYYLLPEGYKGNINRNFIDTTTGNSSIDAILAEARNATFYAYHDEFSAIVDSSPKITTIRATDSVFEAAKEGGVWVSSGGR